MHHRTAVLCERHRRTQPEIAKLQTHLRLLERELVMHLRKEEETVFPHIRALEGSPQAEPSTSIFFASVRRPVGALMSVMSDEHDLIDTLLERVREGSVNLNALQVSCGNSPNSCYRSSVISSFTLVWRTSSCFPEQACWKKASVLPKSPADRLDQEF